MPFEWLLVLIHIREIMGSIIASESWSPDRFEVFLSTSMPMVGKYIPGQFPSHVPFFVFSVIFQFNIL